MSEPAMTNAVVEVAAAQVTPRDAAVKAIEEKMAVQTPPEAPATPPADVKPPEPEKPATPPPAEEPIPKDITAIGKRFHYDDATIKRLWNDAPETFTTLKKSLDDLSVKHGKAGERLAQKPPEPVKPAAPPDELPDEFGLAEPVEASRADIEKEITERVSKQLRGEFAPVFDDYRNRVVKFYVDSLDTYLKREVIGDDPSHPIDPDYALLYGTGKSAAMEEGDPLAANRAKLLQEAQRIYAGATLDGDTLTFEESLDRAFSSLNRDVIDKRIREDIARRAARRAAMALPSANAAPPASRQGESPRDKAIRDIEAKVQSAGK